MNYSIAIQHRKSYRAFTDRKVPFELTEQIRRYYESSVKTLLPVLQTQLFLFADDVKAPLEGAAGYNQFLVGAPHYLVLLSELHPLAAINAGYIMEDLLLNITDLGLDTCWVTFTDSQLIKQSLGIESNLEVAAILAFGYGKKTTRRLRLNFKSMRNVDLVAKHSYMEPKRGIQELVYLNTWGDSHLLNERIGFFDDVLWESFYAAALAPSYLNRQAYGFIVHDGGISLIRRPDEFTTAHDGDLSLGAALLHFSAVAENWAGPLRWYFGGDASALKLPQGYSLVATCVL